MLHIQRGDVRSKVHALRDIDCITTDAIQAHRLRTRHKSMQDTLPAARRSLLRPVRRHAKGIDLGPTAQAPPDGTVSVGAGIQRTYEHLTHALYT